MNDLKKEGSFDPKTAIAIALIPLIWVVWNSYINKKYPKVASAPVAQEQEKKILEPSKVSSEREKAQAELPSPEGALKGAAPVVKPEKLIPFSSEKVSFLVSSQGMAIKGYTLKQYSDREEKNLKFGSEELGGLFPAYLGQEKISFDIQEISPGVFKGLARVGDAEIVRELKFDSEKVAFQNKISVRGLSDKGLSKNTSISLTIPEGVVTPKSSSFLFPSYEKQDFYVNSGGKAKSVTISTMKQDYAEKYLTVSLVGVSSQYFTTAIMDKSDVVPELDLGVSVDRHEALARLSYVSMVEAKHLDFNQILYVGPKGIDQLRAVDADLAQIIDFGFFGFIAQPLLYLMKGLHSFLGNWGLAIIFLTLLVRLCVMPFNIMSYKSMKSMQKIQPMLQGLREKYKDDPVSLNKEMYALMKENKANPMGGCLPMLLQIPVFFALFRVIGSSIELYKSPFCGWITDLSAHDAFYVLPVLMGGTMYLQQKLTPSTMDPAQAKVMAFLPLLFAFFMFQLPSGLTLYMFVSGLFGITQQYLFMRDKKA